MAFRTSTSSCDNVGNMSKAGNWVKGSINETRAMIGSGVRGANRGLRGAAGDQDVSEVFANAARNSWKAAVIGATIGVVTGVISDDRKPARGAVLVGFLGAAVGLTAGVAWNARAVISAVAEQAAKSLGEARDSQWLARNPIDYA